MLLFNCFFLAFERKCTSPGNVINNAFEKSLGLTFTSFCGFDKILNECDI
jgi:hypothetical protein